MQAQRGLHRCGAAYIGEITLIYGCYALFTSPNWSRVLRSAWSWPLICFMGWGFLRTLPYISQYGSDAFRDAAIWAYGAFAIVISSLIAARPSRLLMLEKYFKSFAKYLLIFSPFTYYLTHFVAPFIPHAPWGDVPWVNIKGGDVVVHLSGIFAYAILLGGLIPGSFYSAWSSIFS